MSHSHCGVLLWAMLCSHAAGSHALLLVFGCERFIVGTGHGAIFGYRSQCQYVMFCDVLYSLVIDGLKVSGEVQIALLGSQR